VCSFGRFSFAAAELYSAAVVMNFEPGMNQSGMCGIFMNAAGNL
jgi:hypothetical protein